LRPLFWEKDCLMLMDQTKLPLEETYLACRDYQAVAEAIRKLQVRGAPAIGVAAAYGMVLGAQALSHLDRETFLVKMKMIAATLRSTRPTAVNLFWAVDRMCRILETTGKADPATTIGFLLNEAHTIFDEDVQANHRIGSFGEKLFPPEARVLTYCNAGALATAGFGTALGVIRAAVSSGKVKMVYACETRPVLQGARLTSWELAREQIPVTVITDNMAASLMGQQKVNVVIVGADRIVANGDVANKIGTYNLGVLAKYHAIPFYVAAPWSTVDLQIHSGADIPIEERDAAEIKFIGGSQLLPDGVPVYNPAFDVTPGTLITAIITDYGVVSAPYPENLARLTPKELA
jgi:methylthioribose-1-phosphate isomerase